MPSRIDMLCELGNNIVASFFWEKQVPIVHDGIHYTCVGSAALRNRTFSIFIEFLPFAHRDNQTWILNVNIESDIMSFNELLFAIKRGDAEMAKKTIKRGIDVNETDSVRLQSLPTSRTPFVQWCSCCLKVRPWGKVIFHVGKKEVLLVRWSPIIHRITARLWITHPFGRWRTLWNCCWVQVRNPTFVIMCVFQCCFIFRRVLIPECESWMHLVPCNNMYQIDTD